MAKKRQPIFTMSLLVTGNLLGAGILALPVNLGPAGMIPAASGIVLVWAIMLWSSFVLAGQKELTSGAAAGLPTFFGLKLGPAGKWLATAADLIILYGVLTAYLTGTTSIVTGLFSLPVPDWAVCLAYFVVAAGLTGFGGAMLRSCNAVILIAMGVTFTALIVMTAGHVEPARALPMRWSFLPAAMPVVLTAFLYHNLIPTVCRELDNDQKAIRLTLFIGSAIGLAMNLLWTTAVFCSLPFETPAELSIMNAFEKNLPATIPLSRLLDSKAFTDIGLLFAVLSMTAAFMANGTALLDFLRDLAGGKARGAAVWLAGFAPPLLVSIFYPDVFLTAMNVVGGVGVCVIFGILPAFILLREKGAPRARTATAWAMLAVFGLILVFELGQELGLTHIRPDVEYWLVNGK